MKIFFDTSVLVAASAVDHPHHVQAFPALQRVVAGTDQGFISNHSIAETYSALTRLPVVPRIHPSEAARIVRDTILPHMESVALVKRDYLQALAAVQQGGWIGAKIYDALLLACAAKADPDRIYTFNLSDFRALAPPSLQRKICVP
jgi:predicted nucleic acid-binding protein